MKTEKFEKLVANLHGKTNNATPLINLKQPLNNELVLKKVYGLIKFNQIAWLQLYIDMHIDLRQKAKTDFEKEIFKLMQ